MISLARNGGNGGALFSMNGTVANNATWQEDIYYSEDGAPMLLTGLSFKMTFRCDPGNTSADLTISTADGTLSIQNDDDGYARVLRVNVPATTLSSYCGDYIADLASEDASEVVTLWAHGTVTFANNPVAF